ncbi:hypothetical protein F7R02_18300 [Xanthomonas cissicola]|nr:hypothetical protein F7R02_18300 [Xanthomonas cissicola]
MHVALDAAYFPVRFQSHYVRYEVAGTLGYCLITLPLKVAALPIFLIPAHIERLIQVYRILHLRNSLSDFLN